MSEIDSNNKTFYDAAVDTDTYRSHEVHKIANAPVAKYAFEYNMQHKNRGLALIFNHEIFEDPGLETRLGTNIDCENLKNTFENLNFDVRIHKDLKFSKILYYLSEASKMDHTDNDCIVICILSHGQLGLVYANDIQYELEIIWSYFAADKCPTLAGKPKLIFIQACQGDRSDGGITVKVQADDGEQSSFCSSYKIPTHADFLIAYSTIPGFYSWRNQMTGSWFIQSLCKELNLNGKRLDILTLLTFVCQRVALDFESNKPDCITMHQQKQMPCITTMLTRMLRFTDK